MILKISKRGPSPFFKEEKAWEEMFSMRKLVKRLNWQHKELKDLLVPNNYQQKLSYLHPWEKYMSNFTLRIVPRRWRIGRHMPKTGIMTM